MTDSKPSMASVEQAIRAYCEANHDFAFKPGDPIVRLHEPTFSGDEIWAAVECMLTTQVTMGAKVRAFEEEFAKHFGYAEAVMVNSGSSANLLAVAALCNPVVPGHLKPGDEVIVPALCWSTTVWPLIQCGLVPVVVDIDPVTLNIDPGEIERAIGPKTRAIKLVHVYGNPCDMDAIGKLCAKHDLQLIEDSCEALGAFYDGKAVGRFGRVGTFSFYYSHHMTTLEGGMCVTDDAEFAETMRILRAHGWVRETKNRQRYLDQYPDIDPRFLFVNVGYNLRATELQGAMGSVQLPKLDGYIRQRKENADWLRQEFARFGNLVRCQEETPGSLHSWFGFPMQQTPGAPYSVKDLCRFLNARKIETRPVIAGNIAAQPAMKLYAHRVQGDLHHADHIMQNGFVLPNHQEVGPAARRYLADGVAEFFAKQGLN
jgi:CDP-6-deoxy-D-xylo-4-hexulose-3-dehydrase